MTFIRGRCKLETLSGDIEALQQIKTKAALNILDVVTGRAEETQNLEPNSLLTNFYNQLVMAENGTDSLRSKYTSLDQLLSKGLSEIKTDSFEKAMNDINAKSEEIHQKDQVLELQLRQLDTEQETITTELESVKKVIDKNIENVFKTFQS